MLRSSPRCPGRLLPIMSLMADAWVQGVAFCLALVTGVPHKRVIRRNSKIRGEGIFFALAACFATAAAVTERAGG